jgi:acetyltransferase-like isoleucine patch superfamily enzyme
VTIGHHSVLATGAVIHKDVPPYSLVVGGGFRIAKALDPAELEDVRADLMIGAVEPATLGH